MIWPRVAMPLAVSPRARRFLAWGAILLAWTVIVLTVALQAYVFAVSPNVPDSFRREFFATSAEWYVSSPLTPLALLLCRRYRITGRNWRISVPVHLAAGIVVSLLQLLIQVRLT